MNKNIIINNLKIYKNYHLSPLTTYKIGGAAEYYCEPKNIKEIKTALAFADDNELTKTIIGGGSNVLISDKGVNGFVISTNKLLNVKINNNLVVAESGISIDKLNQKMISNSFSGLEFSGGLPGTVGGAIYMNARAYGRQMSDVVCLVCAMNTDGELLTFSNKKIGFDYKKSIFTERSDLIILNVTFELKKRDKKEIKQKYKKNILDRESKGQFMFPSAGCVFKNDYEIGIPSGKIIDKLGLRGLKIGGAQISEKHGNFIFNVNKARSEDIKELIETIEKKVLEKKGITLQREIKLIGF